VLDEEAARQEAQARASEQVIFPDDMLRASNRSRSTSPGVPKGGKLMFVVLGC